MHSRNIVFLSALLSAVSEFSRSNPRIAHMQAPLLVGIGPASVDNLPSSLREIISSGAITPGELAFQINVSPSTVLRWITGRGRPNKRNFGRIQEVLSTITPNTHINGDRIRAFRIEKGITQRALAIHLNVSAATISNWESGRTAPSAEYQERVQQWIGNHLEVLPTPPDVERNRYSTTAPPQLQTARTKGSERSQVSRRQLSGERSRESVEMVASVEVPAIAFAHAEADEDPSEILLESVRELSERVARAFEMIDYLSDDIEGKIEAGIERGIEQIMDNSDFIGLLHEAAEYSSRPAAYIEEKEDWIRDELESSRPSEDALWEMLGQLERGNYAHQDDVEVLTQSVGNLEYWVNVVRRKLRSGGPNRVARKIRNRIRRAQESGKLLTGEPFASHLTPPQLVSELWARDFLLDEEIAQQILTELKHRKILILSGVPGTGKSTLAKLLCEIFLPEYDGQRYSMVTVTPETSARDSVGSVRMVEGGFLPHLGWLTEAVFTCCEAGGHHWLVIDEINRGNAAVFLGPALDALSPGSQAGFTHPRLFPDEPVESGEVPMPGSFRIIGTMNPRDNDVLFEFSEALRRRVGVVHMKHPTRADEARLIREVVLPPLLKGASTRIRERAYKYVSLVLQLVESIRTLAVREPPIAYAACDLGTATVIDAIRRGNSYLYLNPDAENLIDRVFCDLLLGSLGSFSRQALVALLDEAFPEEMTLSRTAIIEHLRSLRRI